MMIMSDMMISMMFMMVLSLSLKLTCINFWRAGVETLQLLARGTGSEKRILLLELELNSAENSYAQR